MVKSFLSSEPSLHPFTEIPTHSDEYVPLSRTLSEHFLSLSPQLGSTGPLEELHQFFIPRFKPEELLSLPELSSLPSLRFIRDPLTGSIISTQQSTSASDPTTSSSLTRRSIPLHKRNKGSVEYLPFEPASKTSTISTAQSYDKVVDNLDELIANEKLLSTLPGLPPGITPGVQEETSGTVESVVQRSNLFETVDEEEIQKVLSYYQGSFPRTSVDYNDDYDLLQDNIVLGSQKSKSLRKSAAKVSESMLSLESSQEPDDVIEEVAGSQAEKEELTGGPLDFTDLDTEFDELFSDEIDLASMVGVTRKKTGYAELDQSNVDDFHSRLPFPALTFPFELDTFQKRAILRLESGENVFVAAHTSAGKTVVAEYALGMAKKIGAKTIYTSPIKTLSNQKYRDFKERFDDVGIMTGDVTLNPTASCLIMTTEILRNLLYRGADIIRDTQFVIFDECHYLNDPERGVVWEECLILLPKTVQTVLLSATVPNLSEFADWVGRIQKKFVWIITTPFRPVPLVYYLATGTSNPIKLIDQKGSFDSASLKQAKSILANTSRSARAYMSQWMSLINHLKKKELLPAIVFCFSKKGCEEVADHLTSLDFSSDTSAIHLFIKKSLNKRLSAEDQNLPQIRRVSDLLVRGIGIHHAGLLPILKEIVEMLFQRGLISVLIATETFAMGINMPARSVIFAGLKKHDGREFRFLHPSEFTQISGRAGRRGLDKEGNVYIVLWLSEVPDEPTLKGVVRGRPTKLTSQFRVSYNMLLNLLRTKALGIGEMLRLSYYENHLSKMLPSYKNMLQKMKHLLESLPQIECPYGCVDVIDDYHEINQKVADLDQLMIELARRSREVIECGSIVLLKNRQHYDLGLVLQKSENTVKLLIFEDIFPKALPYVKISKPQTSLFSTCYTRSFPIETIVRVSKSSLKLNPSLASLEPLRTKFLESIKNEITAKINTEQVDWHDGQSLGIFNHIDFADIQQSKATLLSLSEANTAHKCPRLDDHYPTISQKFHYEHNANELAHRLSDAALALIPDLNCRLKVLRQLKYIDEENNVLLKGRVACELSTVEDLIITEAIFENLLQKLEPAEVASILSIFVAPKTRSQPDFDLPPNLLTAKDFVTKVTVGLALIQQKNGLETDAAEYLKNSINFSLMDVVYHWANGESFSSITELTDIPEGTIVRSILRLDETCRDIRNAAYVIGDRILSAQMEEVSKCLRRDIVFAASLYLT
ncbi:hypothetical protein GEMRC1_006375 [Eukaryota sp. GEM-RC1]